MTALVDWTLAQRVACRVAKRESFSETYHAVSLVPDFAEFTALAEDLVAKETGLRSMSGAARARVVDRNDWVAANISSFQRLMKPVLEKLGGHANRPWLSSLTGKASGTEVGILLGWMSTRVLGQYDLLIIEDENPEDQDIVYYVGPNVLALERKYGFPPREFRLWLALHEVTHRAQFTGVPWLREHFLSLVQETIDAVDPDPKRLLETIKGIIEAKRRGEDPMADGGLPMLLAGPEQREVLERIGGMMSLLEGHGDITMDRAGVDHVPGAERFAKTLRQRRNSAKGFARIFQKVIGIEAKLNQYAAGERFIEAVEEAGGPELVNRAWIGPEYLPSMAEIREPQIWIDRVQTKDAVAG